MVPTALMVLRVSTLQRVAGYVVAALLVCSAAYAAPQVEALGMFRGGAILSIDGQQRMLHEGETSPEGCRLVQASANAATVQCRGSAARRLVLSDRAGGSYAQVKHPTVRVPIDPSGQFRVRGAINGVEADMVVDTGATVMAVSAMQAAALGIQVPRNAREGLVATANGKARARQVVLERVDVGGITVPNVHAVVVDGAYPETVLLGMSFLEAVQIQHSGGLMVLTGH